mmetsp:Transcript_10959/g.46789  ORF Transcript_10959/g.46789 Transcript_10959/m.46789 type:complete len:341 (+) Transcript_10959:892-1914(+)
MITGGSVREEKTLLYVSYSLHDHATRFAFRHCNTTYATFPSLRMRAMEDIVSLSSFLSSSELSRPFLRRCFVTSFVVTLPPLRKSSRRAASMGRAPETAAATDAGSAFAGAEGPAPAPRADLATRAAGETRAPAATSSSDRERFTPAVCAPCCAIGVALWVAASEGEGSLAVAACIACILSRRCSKNGCSSSWSGSTNSSSSSLSSLIPPPSSSSCLPSRRRTFLPVSSSALPSPSAPSSSESPNAMPAGGGGGGGSSSSSSSASPAPSSSDAPPSCSQSSPSALVMPRAPGAASSTASPPIAAASSLSSRFTATRAALARRRRAASTGSSSYASSSSSS